MDYNYFATIVSPGIVFTAESQITTIFKGPRYMMFVGKDGNNIEYSFNGSTVHGRISINQIFNFGLRAGEKIWFRGIGTVDVHIWGV